MTNQKAAVAVILIGVLLIQTGCATSDDPEKRKKRALLGATTSTALGVATGVGGPMLLARAAMGAASRVTTGEAMDKIKDKDKPEVDDVAVPSDQDTNPEEKEEKEEKEEPAEA